MPCGNSAAPCSTRNGSRVCGIHPLVAIKVCGLWTDAEKVFLLSKPYLDNLYKTIDDAIKEQGLQSQVDKANQLVEQFNNSKEQAATE